MKIYFSALCFLLFINEVCSQLQPTRVCGIQIVIDKFLWRKFLSDVETVERELEVKEKNHIARYNLVSLTGRVVAQANNVLSNQFLGRIKYKLILQDIQILDEDCGGLCDPELDLETLLNTFSYSSRDGYCLSYLLTYRTFENGKLGLAYTATTFHGGVCETFREQKEVLFGFERSINKSLNTGIVSFQRNGRQVSEQVGALTFAHEIGHSFGAVHDPVECAGNEEDGTYLMYKSGSLGLKKNNMEFSSCSVSAMSGVLSSLELREGGTCWILDSGRGICGNGVVEVWEECDCGLDPDICEEQCCIPPGDKLGRQPCKRTPGVQCSPSEGVCCTSKCEYSSSTTVCDHNTECTEPVQCTGKQSYCPLPLLRPESSLCAQGSKTCIKGKCEGSICQSLGMLPCTTSTSDPVQACTPHCYTPYIPCTPSNISFPDGVECGVDEVYGYCGGGACLLGAEQGVGTWIVGVVVFLVFYALFLILVVGIYCRYCRGKRIKRIPGKHEDSDECGDNSLAIEN